MTSTTPEPHPEQPHANGWPHPGPELPPWQVAARFVPVPPDTLRRVKAALERK
jgi:hypothetical protein